MTTADPAQVKISLPADTAFVALARAAAASLAVELEFSVDDIEEEWSDVVRGHLVRQRVDLSFRHRGRAGADVRSDLGCRPRRADGGDRATSSRV